MMSEVVLLQKYSGSEAGMKTVGGEMDPLIGDITQKDSGLE